jgi:hypothetical protein
MSMLESPIIMLGQTLVLGSKAIMNVENLYMIIKQIFFLVFSLNLVAIYSTVKIINVSCDDNIVKLSYNGHHVISPIYDYA